MAELVGHDIGFTLRAKCDMCDTEIMAFGSKSERTPIMGKNERAELESILAKEGWAFLGYETWLCERCASHVVPPADS